MTTAIFASATAVVLYWLMLRYQRGLGKECAVIFAVFGSGLVSVAAIKTNSPPARAIRQVVSTICTNAFNALERQTGYAVSAVRTNETHGLQRNDSPLGTAYVYNGTIHDSLLEQYGVFHADGLENFELKNDWRNVPLPLSASLIADYIAQVALHECGHTMGLVPTPSAQHTGHNDCICGGHFMDSGSFRGAPVYLGFVRLLVQFWKPENRSYLEFVFPLSPQGGNP